MKKHIWISIVAVGMLSSPYLSSAADLMNFSGHANTMIGCGGGLHTPYCYDVFNYTGSAQTLSDFWVGLSMTNDPSVACNSFNSSNGIQINKNNAGWLSPTSNNTWDPTNHIAYAHFTSSGPFTFTNGDNFEVYFQCSSSTLNGLGTANFNNAGTNIATEGMWEDVATTQSDVQNFFGVAPLNISNPQQYQSDAATAIAAGGMVTSSAVVFGATLNSNGTSTLQLQAEVKPTGFPFTGTANVTGTLVSPGARATTTYIGSNGSYHWQARVVDGNGSSSVWQTFGINATSTVDFIINNNPINEASVRFTSSSGWAWSASNLSFNDTDPFTIELWYKATSTGDLVDTRSSSTGKGFLVSKNSNGINLSFACDATSSVQIAEANYGVNKDTTGYWHHVAITKATTTPINGFTFYFDGAQQTSTNCFDSSTTRPIWFGRSAITSTDFFDGYMDEVRIWNVARSASQIAASATQEISATSTGLIGYWTFNTTSTDLATGHATSGQSGTPTFSSSTPLGFHFIDFTYPPSVHNGGIKWNGSTQFAPELNGAVNTWNAAGPIRISSTSNALGADIVVQDINTSTYPWTGVVGEWSSANGNGADSMIFNAFYLASNTYAAVQNTATHELGHALGLDHSVFGNVMYYIQTTSTNPGSQDISDYNYLWGN